MLQLLQTRTFRGWHWALVPLLAVLAYATVLRIGFLSDDFVLLAMARSEGITLKGLLPDPIWPGYRPAGALLTWRLGWQLWGANPLPYHLIGLFLHAGTSLMLGLWLAQLTAYRTLGWLAGLLFAVFPLHLEAVGWLAAQWDSWATFFGVGGLWLFAKWLRSAPDWRLYVSSLTLYGLGVFSKESLLTFLPMFAISILFLARQTSPKSWLRTLYVLLPFCAVLALNIGIRLSMLGSLGAYEDAEIGYFERLWDKLIAHLQVLLAPVNRAVFNNTAADVTAVLSGLCLLIGIVLFGRKHIRVLLVCAAWVLLALLPVLNLPIKADDLQQNRFLYLASAGYCAVWAVLLHSAASQYRRLRLPISVFTGVLLLLGVATSWVQLRPWHTASVQAVELEQELLRFIPPSPSRSSGMSWYVENIPDNYRGAYVFRLGFGVMRQLAGINDVLWIESVQNAHEIDVAIEESDAFALRLRYDGREERYHVAYGTGITSESAPPTGSEDGDSFLLWDFTACAPDVLQGWHVIQAQARCETGKGLVLQPATADAQMVGPAIEVKPLASGARFVRLRVLALYSPDVPASSPVYQWYWRGPGNDWSETRNRTMPIKQDGKPHVYWTFVPADEAGEAISGLRFDPVNGRVSSIVQWIAIDLVR